MEFNDLVLEISVTFDMNLGNIHILSVFVLYEVIEVITDFAWHYTIMRQMRTDRCTYFDTYFSIHSIIAAKSVSFSLPDDSNKLPRSPFPVFSSITTSWR